METRKLAAILFAGRVLAAGTLMALLAVNEGALAQDPEPMPPSPARLHPDDDTGVKDGTYTQKNVVRLIGQTQPSSKVRLLGPPDDAEWAVTEADATGNYQFVNIRVNFGRNNNSFTVMASYPDGGGAAHLVVPFMACNQLPPVGRVWHADPSDTERRPVVDYQSSTDSLAIKWEDFAVGHSAGIAQYWIAVGGEFLDDHPGPHNFGSRVIRDLTLTHGSKYYVTLTVEDKAGLRSGLTTTGVTVDTTNPEIWDVRDGAAKDGNGDYKDVNEWPFTNAFYATFPPGTDPESGVVKYEIALGTWPGGTDEVGFTKSSVAFNRGRYIVGLFDLNLKKDVTYYATIRATNGADLFGESTSDGFVVVVQ